ARARTAWQGQAIVAAVPALDVGGARLWYDEAGTGPAVLLLHGDLGDSGLWEPVVPLLAERVRAIRTDLRFFGRSTGPAAPWSWPEDVVGVLDGLGLERAALVGLSLGGQIALDVALAHPERLWALGLVAPTELSGCEAVRYTAAQRARYEQAQAAHDLEAMMAVDFEVSAPLGADERMRRLWHATPKANPLPAGLAPLRPSGAPAAQRLDELGLPVLVVTVAHDPPGLRAIGPLVARSAPQARHVELDSDQYATLREPELVARVLLEFLLPAPVP
ncbi:MAG TPA: alpha/beta fold hydrolase, partial [Gaiellaceae bacterium]|nr:alpha/beta fold hydrolase [Gaiellaceae bacterium]